MEFFNKLLVYRTQCEEELERGESYADWYSKNFGRSHAIAASIQNNLQDSFSGKGEERILDLFMDIPKDQENKYLQGHFEKLDKEIANIIKASKTRDILTNSITFMEHLRQIEANEKMLKKKVGRSDERAAREPEHGSYLPPYLLINKNALISAQPTSQKNGQGMYKDAHNERAQRHPHQTIQQCLRCQDDTKTKSEMVKKFHGLKHLSLKFWP